MPSNRRVGRPRVDWLSVDQRASAFAGDRILCAAIFGRLEPALRDALIEDLQHGRVTRTLVLAVAKYQPEEQLSAFGRLHRLTARQAKRSVELERNPITIDQAADRIARWVRNEFPIASPEGAAQACECAAALLRVSAG